VSSWVTQRRHLEWFSIDSLFKSEREKEKRTIKLELFEQAETFHFFGKRFKLIALENESVNRKKTKNETHWKYSTS
jgi:hypothetical protein